MFIEIVVEGTPLPAVLDPTHRCGHIARRACRSRSARKVDWRYLEIALRKCWRGDETKNYCKDFRCHYRPWVNHDAIA
jgi:hypothetical protein